LPISSRASNSVTGTIRSRCTRKYCVPVPWCTASTWPTVVGPALVEGPAFPAPSTDSKLIMRPGRNAASQAVVARNGTVAP
jgi:hypothetical protein